MPPKKKVKVESGHAKTREYVCKANEGNKMKNRSNDLKQS